MGLLIDGLKLPIERWQIEEILDARLRSLYNTSFEDFFIVTYGEKFHVGKAHTKYGRIPVFFTSECPTTSVYILNKKKFPYPTENLSRTSTYNQNGDLIQ